MKATSLIDEFLPEHDFRAAYQTSIHAPATLVYQHLLSFDLYASWIVRLLVSLRYGRRTPRMRAPGDLRRRFQCSGFVILAEAPGEELVVGVAGRFWHPDGGRRLDLSIHDFAGFSCPGEAKIAFNFRVRTGAASRFSAFDRDQDSVLWPGGLVEVLPVLGGGAPFLWPDPEGDSAASKDRCGVSQHEAG